LSVFFGNRFPTPLFFTCARTSTLLPFPLFPGRFLSLRPSYRISPQTTFSTRHSHQIQRIVLNTMPTACFVAPPPPAETLDGNLPHKASRNFPRRCRVSLSSDPFNSPTRPLAVHSLICQLIKAFILQPLKLSDALFGTTLFLLLFSSHSFFVFGIRPYCFFVPPTLGCTPPKFWRAQTSLSRLYNTRWLVFS